MTMLRDMISERKDDILVRARARLLERSEPLATEAELVHGLPVFLDQLLDALSRAHANEVRDHSEIEASAGQHGHDLFLQGVTVAQVVHDYGDLCQVITGLAVEDASTIAPEEFRTLNLCLDDAIAGAVTQHALQREQAISEEGTERLGVLAHEMRNVLSSALLSFGSIKKGIVPPGGSTGLIHERSLLRLSSLIDRTLADVRLDSGMPLPLEPVAVGEILEEFADGPSTIVGTRRLRLVVGSMDPPVVVMADRQTLAAAVDNLVQNALKFTGEGTTVTLGVRVTETRVLIEVQDECGGLPPGLQENLLRPFVQKGRDRTGVGLGLFVCLKTVKAHDGELRIRDLPGKGCVFTIDLPRAPAVPAAAPSNRAVP